MSASPTDRPSTSPSGSPTIIPTSSPSDSPTNSALPSISPSSSLAPSQAPTNSPDGGDLCLNPPVLCPTSFSSKSKSKSKGRRTLHEDQRGLRRNFSKGKKNAKSSDNSEVTQFIPICVVTGDGGKGKGRRVRARSVSKSGKTGKSGEITYETRCIDPSLYEDLLSDVTPFSVGRRARKKTSKGGSSLSLEDFSCGCCGPDLEDDLPEFCLGPPICEGTPTPCIPNERRVRARTGREGRNIGSTNSRDKAGGTMKRAKGRMMSSSKGNPKRGKGKSSRDNEGYVTICENGVTRCVYQYDQVYLSRTDYSCGAC